MACNLEKGGRGRLLRGQSARCKLSHQRRDGAGVGNGAAVVGIGGERLDEFRYLLLSGHARGAVEGGHELRRNRALIGHVISREGRERRSGLLGGGDRVELKQRHEGAHAIGARDGCSVLWLLGEHPECARRLSFRLDAHRLREQVHERCDAARVGDGELVRWMTAHPPQRSRHLAIHLGLMVFFQYRHEWNDAPLGRNGGLVRRVPLGKRPERRGTLALQVGARGGALFGSPE